ncbi:hypothetical protein HZU40_11670 [Mycolicibacterium fluoranthenivorans]|uniref:Uncharacterized protein n=1 Tax=Mycolicibacterium fluoranthenivorans TaxID=258505 RepID=A0A7G8PKH7_9MYCO|nr:hypothetical protein [Mycolicibacterium fluoranthenivorans]QNJ94843.1 hypothetical protein HZU40_11670 [Mycolicibacterium fluoranthenivorans]
MGGNRLSLPEMMRRAQVEGPDRATGVIWTGQVYDAPVGQALWRSDGMSDAAETLDRVVVDSMPLRGSLRPGR